MDRRECGITTLPEIITAESQTGSTEISPPPRVPEKTYRFLIDAIKNGVYENLNPRKRNLIDLYFGTEAVLSDLTGLAGVKTGQGVRYLLLSGMEQLWQNLPSHLQGKYPLKEVRRLKTYKGRKYARETRERTRKTLQRKWQEDPGYRARVIEALRGKRRPPETRERISAALKGREVTLEHRRKLSVALQGRTFTLEHRRRMKKAAERRWRRRRREMENIDGQLWKFATNNGSLAKMVATGTVREEEIEILREFFEGEGDNKKPSESLFNRFSIALARVG